MPIFRRCNNCHQLYEGRKCPECSKKKALQYAKRRAERNEATKLYGHRRWKNCRKNVLLKYLGYDIWLLAVGQLYKCEAPIVHHIKERDEAPDLIYDIDNLITVSRESHEEIHRMYQTDKAAALERIQKGIEEFERRFAD